MRRRMACFLGVVTFLLLLVSCFEGTGQGYSNTARWEYSIEITYNDFFGNIQFHRGKVVTRVDGQKNINGKNYHKIVTIESGIPTDGPIVEYQRVSKDGVYRTSGEKDAPEYLLEPSPLTVGKTWFVPDAKNANYGAEYRVEAIEPVELLDKTYENCTKISFQGITRGQNTDIYVGGEFYNAPGIGMVKMTKKLKGGSTGTVNVNLESYKQ